MNFKPEQYDEIVLVLENDNTFYRKYTNRDAYNTYGKRRRLIATALGYGINQGFVSGIPRYARSHDVVDRDQIRRYFDERYQIPQSEVNTYAEHPSWFEKPRAEDLRLGKLVEDRPTAPHLSAAGKELQVFLASAKDLCNEVAGIPSPPQIYTHPNAPGMQYRKGAGKAVEYRREGGTWRSAGWNADDPKFPLSEARGYVLLTSTPVPTPTETTMNLSKSAIKITTKTFANGDDISNLTDSQIYGLIADQEDEIKKLSGITNKPKRLVAELAERQAGIDALVAYLDSKE